MCDGSQEYWLCLEPDPHLVDRIQGLIEQRLLPPCCEVKVGSLASLEATNLFDTIIYIDVLEHIEADRNELQLACNFLSSNGRLIVLSPAYQWLYTEFDRNIGHCRRYNRRSLLAITPKPLQCLKIFHLDSVGLLASIGNKLFLRSSMPSHQQIKFWDSSMIPLSKLFDGLISYSAGRSVIGILEKSNTSS